MKGLVLPSRANSQLCFIFLRSFRPCLFCFVRTAVRKVLRFKAFWDDHTPCLARGIFAAAGRRFANATKRICVESSIGSLWKSCLRYGARIYFIIHYFLADNSVEINEAQCRNSGRDSYPVSSSDVEQPDTIEILQS